MDLFSGTGRLSSVVTQLYTEAKQSALSNAVTEDATPALTSLNRKFRIQKDRLITWGLEWTDQGKGTEGNIDESVARAGLTETVTSVLENIKEIFSQVHQIRVAQSQPWPSVIRSGKELLTTVDQNKYPDLINDLTTSIDILYDLSSSRIALAAGSHPTFDNKPDSKLETMSIKSAAAQAREAAQQPSQKPALFRSPSFASSMTPSFASSELTLVNPSSCLLYTSPSPRD